MVPSADPPTAGPSGRGAAERPRQAGRKPIPPHLIGLIWMSRLSTVMLEMVTPVILGRWLDRRFDTTFLAPAGLLLGVPLGIWHIWAMLRADGRLRAPRKGMYRPLPPRDGDESPSAAARPSTGERLPGEDPKRECERPK